MTSSPRLPWAIVAAAVPVHLALALATDLSPDEAYYLCAARHPGALPAMVDHPPLLPWLLRLSDAATFAPVELRVRIWALLFSFLTGLGCVALAQRRGAGLRGSVLAAIVGSFALLPMAGGFVTTPDGPALAAIAGALLLVDGPTSPRRALAAGALLLVSGLAKVVALPIAAALAIGSRRSGQGARTVLAVTPLLALPLLLPSLAFQLRHAYGQPSPTGWSIGGALGSVTAAAFAQALLWSPAVLWLGLRDLRAAPLPDRLVALGLTGLLVGSGLLRAVPPEPNWWAPAALVVVAGFARAADSLSTKARAAIAVSVILPAFVAAAHTVRPFLPLPAHADPTARLHGWSAGRGDPSAPGVGAYGPAAERCVYAGVCDDITSYFNEMVANR